MGLDTQSITKPRIDKSTLDYYRHRLQSFTICETCYDLIRSSFTAPIHFNQQKGKTKKFIQPGSYFAARVHIFSNEQMLYRLLGKDFILKAGSLNVHNVVACDRQSIERFVQLYSHKLKAIVKFPTMYPIEMESKLEV